MGLLDSILGAADPSQEGTAPPEHAVVSAIGDLINQHGGVTGLAQQFGNKGFANVFSSWVGTGANHNVSPEQIHQAVGQDQVATFAQKLGIDPAMAAMLIAQFLPKIIDHLTPAGHVAPEHENPGQLQALLRSGLGKLLSR